MATAGEELSSPMDRLTLLEQRVEELARSVDELAQIVSQLAGRPIGVPRGGEAPFGEPPAETAAALGSALPGGFALVGRSLVALGGAYLLRALTAAGLLPELGGVLLAFVYALFWLALAHRAGSRARTASASFHGATAVGIRLPLLWEATSRFH